MKLEYILKSKLNFFIFLFSGFLLSFILPPYNYFFLGFVIFPLILYLLKKNQQASGWAIAHSTSIVMSCIIKETNKDIGALLQS